MKVGLRLERRYSQRLNFAISPVDGSVCQEKFGIHSIAALPLSSVYQISPNIHCHLPEKSQSSTAGNNGAPTSVPLSLGHALYFSQNIVHSLVQINK